MERLCRRGEPEELLSRHVAFADWLRRHAQDPSHMPHVLTTDGWSVMQWSRLSEMGREQWRMTVINGSAEAERKRVLLCLQWIDDVTAGTLTGVSPSCLTSGRCLPPLKRVNIGPTIARMKT